MNSDLGKAANSRFNCSAKESLRWLINTPAYQDYCLSSLNGCKSPRMRRCMT
jgi:hypothetical protein